MNNLDKSDYKTLDRLLLKHKEIDRMIALRKYEIDDRPNDDENIGGGRSSNISRTVEDTVIRYSQDTTLIALYNMKTAVEETKKELAPELLRVFNLRWGAGNYNSWQEIAELVGYNENYIYKKRDYILNIYARKIGFC